MHCKLIQLLSYSLNHPSFRVCVCVTLLLYHLCNMFIDATHPDLASRDHVAHATHAVNTLPHTRLHSLSWGTRAQSPLLQRRDSTRPLCGVKLYCCHAGIGTMTVWEIGLDPILTVVSQTSLKLLLPALHSYHKERFD